FAAQSHRQVEDVHAGLAQEAQGDSAGNALVVRVWRKEQRLGGIGCDGGLRRQIKASQRVRFALSHQACVLRNQLVIGVHIFGKLAAATAWPWRLFFSSGRWKAILPASSGNSAFNTALASAMMISPPGPEVT